MDFPTAGIEKLVLQLAKLPGIGRKTALRLTLALLHWPDDELSAFGQAILDLKKTTFDCKQCGNLSDSEYCKICTNNKRQSEIICVVESVADLIAIEKTQQFHGTYHVLGGLINPMEGIGPEQLNIQSLLNRLKQSQNNPENTIIKEVIFALDASMEGETTTFYLAKQLSNYKQVKLSNIARGVPIGSELEFTDEITLGRSFLSRTAYQING
jgi:recombination protein RecR